MNRTQRSVGRALVLALLVSPVVSACVSRTSATLPEPGMPVPEGVIGAAFASGEEIDLRDQDYELREEDLVVRTSGTSDVEGESIPRDEIQELVVEEPSWGTNVVGVLLAAAMAVGSGLVGAAISF